MSKWCGNVGYETTSETSPGVFEEIIEPRRHYGDVLRSVRRLTNSGTVNDNISISIEISIVADPFALKNFHSIRYVEYMGAKWKVTSAEARYPRIILTPGEVYNG